MPYRAGLRVFKDNLSKLKKEIICPVLRTPRVGEIHKLKRRGIISHFTDTRENEDGVDLF